MADPTVPVGGAAPASAAAGKVASIEMPLEDLQKFAGMMNDFSQMLNTAVEQAEGQSAGAVEEEGALSGLADELAQMPPSR